MAMLSCTMCESCPTKIPDFSNNGSAFSVCRFCHSALQSFKCVCEAWTRVHTQSSLSIFTTLGTAILSSLHSGVVVHP